jgi:phospholipase/carboxylesterase
MRQLGKIKCLEQINSQNLENSNEWIILFHGFGADAYDLQSLSEVLRPANPQTNWLFPQGPLQVPIGPGWMGRAWWNIDLEDLQRRQQQGETEFRGKADGLIAIRPEVKKMIGELKVDWSKIVLGGFSQGAMLATDIFLNAPVTPKGLMIFSGALLNKDEWKTLLSKRQGAHYFLSHGTNDTVLPHKTAQQLESFLNSGGLKGRLVSFNGGHEIPPEVIIAANDYLKKLG